MGIPKLVTFLQPYASRISLVGTSPSGEDSKILPGLSQRGGTRADHVDSQRPWRPTAGEAIIDGPALSYHAYGLAVACRNNASNALDAMPAYTEVNAIVLNCLSVLEKHGFTIAAIYFDGLLPSSKEPTRFERLNSSRKQLENFRNSHPSLIAEPEKNRRIVPTPPFSFSSVSEKLRALPALPFLVPAVVEALHESRFDSQTRVVPAEADVYCAKHASLKGGTIFTSDSDLLVYDMIEKTSVVLFKDIEYVRPSKGTVGSVLQITKFDLTAIARRLDLESLEPLAYSVQMSHYRGFNSCLNYARKLQAHENLQTNEIESYQDFVQQYSLAIISLTAPNTALEKVLQRLDPRISEWIQLALASQFRNGQDEQQVKSIDFAAQVFDMYLPFLIDDASRATCWTLGLSIRQLAYSLLRPGNHTTNEWTRRGPRIAEKKALHLDQQFVIERLQEWIHVLRPLQTGLEDNVALWRLMGVYGVCAHLLEIERPLPTREVLWNLLLRRVRGGRDWNVVHLEAQVQAVLYSWRMFRQCVLVCLALPGETSQLGGDYVVVETVSGMLASMPVIATLFDTVIEEKVVESAMEQLYNLLGVKEEDEKPKELEGEEGFKAAASKKRKKRRKHELKSKLPAQKAAKTPRAANLFDVLGVER